MSPHSCLINFVFWLLAIDVAHAYASTPQSDPPFCFYGQTTLFLNYLLLKFKKFAYAMRDGSSSVVYRESYNFNAPTLHPIVEAVIQRSLSLQ